MSYLRRVKNTSLEFSGTSVEAERFSLVLSLLVSLAITAHAQTATTSVRGDVMNPTGAVVSNVDVSLTETSIGFSQTHKTDEKGTYSLLRLVFRK